MSTRCSPRPTGSITERLSCQRQSNQPMETRGSVIEIDPDTQPAHDPQLHAVESHAALGDGRADRQGTGAGVAQAAGLEQGASRRVRCRGQAVRRREQRQPQGSGQRRREGPVQARQVAAEAHGRHRPRSARQGHVSDRQGAGHRRRVRIEGRGGARGHRARRRGDRSRSPAQVDRGSQREPARRRPRARGGHHRVDRRRQRRHAARPACRPRVRPGCVPRLPDHRGDVRRHDAGDVPRFVPVGRVRDPGPRRRHQQGSLRRVPGTVGERDVGARADARHRRPRARHAADRPAPEEHDGRGRHGAGDDHRADTRRDDVDEEDAGTGDRADRHRRLPRGTGTGPCGRPLPGARDRVVPRGGPGTAELLVVGEPRVPTC